MISEVAMYIVSASLCVAYASFVSYSGGEDKWQRFALGAILLSMLACGASSLLGNFSQDATPSVGEVAESTVREDIAREGLERGIERLISERVGCRLSDVRAVATGFKLDEVSAEKITVYLYNEAAFGDHRRIRELILAEGFGECEVILSFEKSGSSAD